MNRKANSNAPKAANVLRAAGVAALSFALLLDVVSIVATLMLRSTVALCAVSVLLLSAYAASGTLGHPSLRALYALTTIAVIAYLVLRESGLDLARVRYARAHVLPRLVGEPHSRDVVGLAHRACAAAGKAVR